MAEPATLGLDLVTALNVDVVLQAVNSTNLDVRADALTVEAGAVEADAALGVEH